MQSTEKERFPRNHAGHYMPDEEVISNSGFSLALFKCRECWALTTDPLLHGMWHEAHPTFPPIKAGD